jgi:hypothetical protein
MLSSRHPSFAHIERSRPFCCDDNGQFQFSYSPLGERGNLASRLAGSGNAFGFDLAIGEENTRPPK